MTTKKDRFVQVQSLQSWLFSVQLWLVILVFNLGFQFTLSHSGFYSVDSEIGNMRVGEKGIKHHRLWVLNVTANSWGRVECLITREACWVYYGFISLTSITQSASFAVVIFWHILYSPVTKEYNLLHFMYVYFGFLDSKPFINIVKVLLVVWENLKGMKKELFHGHTFLKVPYYAWCICWKMFWSECLFDFQDGNKEWFKILHYK